MIYFYCNIPFHITHSIKIKVMINIQLIINNSFKFFINIKSVSRTFVYFNLIIFHLFFFLIFIGLAFKYNIIVHVITYMLSYILTYCFTIIDWLIVSYRNIPHSIFNFLVCHVCVSANKYMYMCFIVISLVSL